MPLNDLQQSFSGVRPGGLARKHQGLVSQQVNADQQSVGLRFPQGDGEIGGNGRQIKEEEVHLNEYRDFEDAYCHIAHSLDDIYMYKRVHWALGYRPPAEFEAQWHAQATDILAEPVDPLEIYRTADRPLRTLHNQVDGRT